MEFINKTDETYLQLCDMILSEGTKKEDRTGTGTISVHGVTTRYKNIAKEFPIPTTKRLHFKSVVGELLWFISGSTNAKELEEKYGCTIWREWAREDGSLGPVYGHQWRNYNSNGHDQIKYVIEELTHNPLSRRAIVNAWNPCQIQDMALPPCHYAFQFVAKKPDHSDKYILDIIVTQRSCDILLGYFFNIVSYSVILMMIAQETGMIPGDIIHNIGDAHIYSNHITYIEEQMKRTHYPATATVELNKEKSIFDFTLEDIKLQNYTAHPNWKNIPVAV